MNDEPINSERLEVATLPASQALTGVDKTPETKTMNTVQQTKKNASNLQGLDTFSEPREPQLHREIDERKQFANVSGGSVASLPVVADKQTAIPSPLLNTGELPGKATVPLVRNAVSKASKANVVAINKKSASESKKQFKLGSDSEIATHVLVDLRKEYESIEYDRNAVWGYRDGIYRKIDPSYITQIVRTYDGAIIGDSDTKTFKANYSKSQGALHMLVEECRKYAIERDEREQQEQQLSNYNPRYTPGFFNNAPRGIAFRNCFVRLNPTTHDVEVLPHSPANRALFAQPFDYTPGVATPLWNKYLCDVWNNYDSAEQASRVDFVEEWIGATLLGDITKYALCLIAIGGGNNGKSVFLTQVEALFPQESICSVPAQRWHSQFEVERIAGKSLNSCEETPDTNIIGNDRFKAIVGGSPVEACKKQENFYRFIPQAGHLFSMNSPHGTNDHSDGYWRRLAPLVFNRKFDEATKDAEFGSKLAKETPGITAIVIEAASRLAKRGRFNIPKSIEQFKNEWRESTNQVLQFLNQEWEGLSTEHKGKVPSKTLYSAFNSWSKSEGHQFPPSDESFSKQAIALGYSKKRVNSGIVWFKE